MAIQRITDSVQRLGADLCDATDLRRSIRRHPFVAMGLGAFAGFLGSPLILRGVRRILAMTSSAPKPASWWPSTLPNLVLESLRGIRARR